MLNASLCLVHHLLTSVKAVFIIPVIHTDQSVVKNANLDETAPNPRQDLDCLPFSTCSACPAKPSVYLIWDKEFESIDKRDIDTDI